MKKERNWVAIWFFIITSLIAVVGVPHYIFSYGLSWFEPAIFIAMYLTVSLSITCGYHRLFSHRTYECSNWMQAFFLIFGAGAFQNSCWKWSSDHRVHHKYVDQDKDPYNARRGFWWSHIGWIINKESSGFPDYVDLSQNTLVMWQKKYFYPLAIFIGFLLPLAIGFAVGKAWGGLLFGGIFRIVVVQHLTFCINSLAHMLGKQPYTDENTARDSWITALFTFGEGYHNFHHWYSRDYRNGIRFYHWDPSKWFIKSMSWLGQTWNLKKVSPEVIMRAKLQTKKLRIQADLSPSLKNRVDELHASLMKQLEELSVQRREWVELKKKASTAELNERWERVNGTFKIKRKEFQQTYSAWKACLRMVQKAAKA